MTWTTSENRLYVDGNVVQELPYPIEKAVEVYGTVVMLACAPPDDIFPDNAFGYRLQNGTSWQIAGRAYYSEASPGVRLVDIDHGDDGEVQLFPWFGGVVTCGVTDGRVIKREDGR